ncbi:MAG: EamA family transporter [Mollicutes bacterium]|nr:EamA family transporter [Mollicutes bacterium]
MEILNSWKFWVMLYLVSAVVFAQAFKKANRNMKSAGALTILLEVFTAFFALFFIPFFDFTWPTDTSVYLTLLAVVSIYAITDRLNIEARYGLDPSVFSMLKQLSTVFLIILGFIFLKEQIVLKKIIGSVIIIFANVLLAFNKGKIKFNKYFIMSFVSNFLFAVAMLINVNISNYFNLAFYTILTVFTPSMLIFIFGKHSLKELKCEFNYYDKKYFLLASFCWCLMLIASVRSYQLGNVTLIAPLLTLTSILNTMYEYFVCKNKSKFIQKVIASILIIIGVVIIKM